MLLMDEEVTSGSELALALLPLILSRIFYALMTLHFTKWLWKLCVKMCRLTYAPIAPSYTYAKVMLSREEIVGFLTRCIHSLAPRAMPKAN